MKRFISTIALFAIGAWSLGLAQFLLPKALAQSVPTLSPPPPLVEMTNSPLTPASSNNGTVHFSFKPCDRVGHQTFSNGLVHYSIWSNAANWTPNWGMNQNVVWKTTEPSAMQRSYSVPPGAYSYEVTAMHGRDSDPSYVFCSQYLYVVVLPGSDRYVTETMYEGLADPIPRVFIYGLASPAFDVSVFRYRSNPECNASLSGVAGTPLDVERDKVGYYASDGYMSFPNEKGAVFGVKVTPKGSTQSRTYRVVADYPDSIVSITPNSARFDVVPSTESSDSVSDTLLCPSTRSR